LSAGGGEAPGERGRVELGLISDTHGLLRPEALDALAGVDRIVHAGDVGGDGIVHRLREIAPVTAVRGNVDRGSWARELPDTATVQVGGVRILVLHIREELPRRLPGGPAAAGFQAVVYGHSHQPAIQDEGGVLFVNPGSAGPRRFDLPVTLMRATVEHGRIDVASIRRIELV
jgi:putative phosphoesterase